MLTLLIYTVFIQWPVQIFCWSWMAFLKMTEGLLWCIFKLFELVLKLIGKIVAWIAPKLGNALINLSRELMSLMKSLFSKANKRVKELLEKTRRVDESPLLDSHRDSNADLDDIPEAHEDIQKAEPKIRGKLRAKIDLPEAI